MIKTDILNKPKNVNLVVTLEKKSQDVLVIMIHLLAYTYKMSLLFGPKGWTNQPTLLALEPCHKCG